MLKDFISEIIASRLVYTIKADDHFASVESQIEEDEQGVPIEIMCIWSSSEIAKSNIQDEWKDYILEAIPLREFLEDWCIGIFNDGLAFCLNLNDETDSSEVQPLDIAFEIADSIKINKLTMEFNSYKNVDEYISAIAPYIIRP